MPIYSIQGPDGNTYSIEGPAGASRADVIQAIQRQMAQQRAQEVAAAPQVATPPAAPSTQRTIGEAILDIPAAGLSGLGGLLQFPGQLVKLVPGLSGLGEVLEKPGELVAGAGDYLKSEGLKARQALQSKAISDAEKDGILSQFATAITSTIKDPALLTTFVAEQVPLLLGPLGAAKVAQKIGAKSIESAGAGLTGKAAEEAVRVAAQRVNKKAATAAYGTGSAMQAADVSSDAYDQAYKQAIEQGLPEDEALRVAANAGRVAGAGAGVVSLLAQRLPGAMAIEKRLAGVPGTQGRVASGFGEALGESLEEGGGQLFKNLGLRQVNPEQPLLEGVGGAAGLGALGGGLLGTALGRKAEEPRFEGQQEGESDRQFAARLQQEIAAGMRPPAPPAPPPAEPSKVVLPGDQQLFTLAAQPNGYGMLENLKQRLIENASIPEDQKKPVIENIRSIQERMNIETVDRLRPMGQPPAPLLPTDEEAQQKAMEMDLGKLGTIVENMGKSIPAYQAVLADPKSLKKEAKKGKLSVEEARSRYQEHIEYINSVLPVYTQVLQQRKQQQQQTKEAEKAQAIANLTPEQQAIRSQAESMINEMAGSGVPEFVGFAQGSQRRLANNEFKTEKDLEFLKSRFETYKNLKQSAGAAKPVDEISLESLNKNYPDDLAKIQEASKDPRLADLFARVNDAMNRSAKAVNALGMSWSGIDSRSSLDIQNVRDIVSGMGGGVGRLVNIKEAIDKGYNRATNDPAKLEQAIRDVEADIETANQRIAKVQALAPAAAPAAPPTPPAPPAPPVQEKVKKIEGPKPKGMPVRAKELPQPAAPVSERQKQIAEMQKDVGRAERQRNAIINKSQSLWSVLVGKLNEQEVNDINPERRFKVLRAKKGVKAGESISTFVANGDMDPWLPPDRRLGMTAYDEYDNTEYIKDLLRGGRENYITHDTKMDVEKLFGSISELDRAIRELLTIEEANAVINTTLNEQRRTAEETGPTAAEVEDRGVAPEPILDEEGRIVRKSLAKVTQGVPPGKFRELERRAKAAPEPKVEEPKAEEPKPEEPKAEEPKPTISPEIQKKIETLGRVLQKNLAKFGLKGIDLNLEQGMADEGSFSGQLIRIALDAQDPLGILRHESIHALKEANFFTDKQWATLERMADQQWIDQYLKGQEVDYEGQVMSRYDAYMKEYAGNMALIREEAIADAFRNFSKKQPAGLMGTLTTRMKNFFKAIKSAFNSQGFESAEDIFGKIEEGKLEAAPVKAEGVERKSLRGANPEDLKNSLSEMRISPRYPTAARATEDPMGDARLQPDLNTFKQNRQSFIFNVGLMNRYPNFRGMRGSADDRVEQMILQMQDNLTWLYNHWKPNFRERSRLWYVGGNRIAHRWAKRYDMPPEKVAGVIAALSPQKGWFANVSIAERMLDAVVNNSDTKWDASMSDVLRSREWGNKLSNVLKYSPVEQLARFEGKTLREIYRPGDQASLLDMAVWIRAWDEAKNPQVSRVITPEGRFTNDLEMTEDGSRPMPLRAQGFGPMTRALMVLQARNREDISLAIGDFDKVRSFYNNIISPYNNDDVTIDTHAVAAALLRPLGSSDLEVSHNFGSAPEDKSERAMSNSSITGLHGSYSVYAEAYRRAARDLGVLPRELQSITWEAVRGLFRPGQKVGAKERANQIWRQVASGAINANEARREISKLVGGIEDPAWTRSPVGSNEAARDSSYQGELPGVGQPGRPEGRGRELPAGTQVERKSLRSKIGLYSELENKVEGVSAKAAPAGQWKTMINAMTQKGVKPEEIEWSGVNDWLDLQEGRVSKDDLLNYLRENGVQVRETVLGDKIDLFEKYLAARRKSDESGNSTNIEFIQKLPEKFRSEEEQNLLDAWSEYTEGGLDAKYGSYTLPGGENYREALLTLPAKVDAETQNLLDQERYLVLTPEQQAKVDAAKKKAGVAYRSRHWDQSNVIAHIRVNDRTDADGNKVLFVEEIQSDWGQEGKKRGFYDPKDVGTREEYLAAKKAAADVIKRTDNLGFDFWPNALNAIRESEPNWRNNFSFDSEEDARIIDEFLLAEARELRRIGRGQWTGIPAAPFVTKTEGWLNLALKRIMVMAAEGGYDKVAFVNGEQSAKRYDLSKQIDRIDANRRGKDSYDIDVSTKEGKDFNRSGLSASDLEDQVGKEMAQKIIDATTEQDKPVRFSGLDLKVGGEGMKTFYDQIVLQAVKKLLPKVGGGQMGVVEINEGEPIFNPDTGEEDLYDYTEQPGFDITPAMREKVETTGLPKFSLRSRPFVDPATEARIDATIIAAPRESLVDRMIDAISPKTFSRLREEFIVTYNELAEVDKRVAAQIRAAGGKEQLADERAESAALLSDQAAAVASSALGAHNRKGGIPVYRNGIVTVDTSGDNEGPVVIFAPLASTGDPKTFRDYQFWATVNRSKKYILNPGQTRYVEQVFEKDDIDRAEQLRRDYAAQGIDFKDIQSRWNKYNNGLVKLMRDTGGISDRAARDFMQHADYFPFYRQVNEEDMAGPKAFSTIAGTKPPKAAKGGEAPMGDFFETVIRNTQAAITLAMKNVAAQRATSQALRINEVVRLSESPQIAQTGPTTWDVMDSQYIDTINAADQAAADAAAQKKFGPSVTVNASNRPGEWNVFKAVKIGDVDAADAQEARQLAYDNHKYRPDITVYKVLENGQPVYYRASDIKFINAIKALNMSDLPFIGLLSAPSNLLRTLVTKDPGYMLVNQMRDSLSAWQTSGVKMTPFIDSARQFAKSIAKTSPEMEALFNAGVIGGYEYAHGQRESGKFLEKEIRRKAGVKSVTEKITTPFTSLWGALERGTQVSDGATRAEVYKRVLAETGNEAEAIWQAAEVLNFYRHGRNPIIRVLTAAVPFLNSRIQGLDVLYRAGMRPAFDKMSTDEQRKRMKTFWVRGMTMFATTFMYWLLTHDDDEYKKQEQETRDNYWLIPSLGIKIAIPFEVGVIFKVLPERLFQSLAGNDTAKDTMDSLKRQLESTLMFSIIPQAVAPYIEVTRNFSSFTQRPIIGQGLENVAPRFQVAPGTSSFAQVVANTLQIETTADSSAFTKGLSKSLEISPVKLDHLIKGYTGTLGQYAVEVFDAIYNLNADVPKPSKRFEQLPVIKRLALDPNARGNVTAYYDLKNAVDEVVRTSNLLERTMNYDAYAPYLRANIGLLANKQYISALEKSMKEFREMKILIRNSKMDSNAKEKAILAVEQMENQLTSNIQQVKVAANR